MSRSIYVLLVLGAACGSPANDSSNDAPPIRDDQKPLNAATQPIYDASRAVEELVYVEAAMDSDADGQPDRIGVRIVRPKETNDSLKVPVIMEAFPYHLDRVSYGDPTSPKSFDLKERAFFVPRGYAVVAVSMQGTGWSQGCPTNGGKEDTLSVVAAIDWLNGRTKGFDLDGNERVATWSTGRVGMIGFSYTGTLAIAAAAHGVDGLVTIVPQAAISSWYDYSHQSGIMRLSEFFPSPYAAELANYVSNAWATEHCVQQRQKLVEDADDASSNYTDFWAERNYVADMSRFKASVFLVHGMRDTNVLPRNFYELWRGLESADTPRKLLLHRDGHADIRYQHDWTQILHPWMDHWLYGIQNGVMSESITTSIGRTREWSTQAVQETRIYLGDGAPMGVMQTTPYAQDVKHVIVDNKELVCESLGRQPDAVLPFRRVYAMPTVSGQARGRPRVHVAFRANTRSAVLNAVLVAEVKGSFYFSNGSIDLKNHASLREETPLVPNQRYEAEWELEPLEWNLSVAERLLLVLTGNCTDMNAIDQDADQIEIDVQGSYLVLPMMP